MRRLKQYPLLKCLCFLFVLLNNVTSILCGEFNLRRSDDRELQGINIVMNIVSSSAPNDDEDSKENNKSNKGKSNVISTSQLQEQQQQQEGRNTNNNNSNQAAIISNTQPPMQQQSANQPRDELQQSSIQQQENKNNSNQSSMQQQQNMDSDNQSSMQQQPRDQPQQSSMQQSIASTNNVNNSNNGVANHNSQSLRDPNDRGPYNPYGPSYENTSPQTNDYNTEDGSYPYDYSYGHTNTNANDGRRPDRYDYVDWGNDPNDKGSYKPYGPGYDSQVYEYNSESSTNEVPGYTTSAGSSSLSHVSSGIEMATTTVTTTTTTTSSNNRQPDQGQYNGFNLVDGTITNHDDYQEPRKEPPPSTYNHQNQYQIFPNIPRPTEIKGVSSGNMRYFHYDNGGNYRREEPYYQIKMYWSPYYYWQESPKERRWCMECESSCSKGNRVIIDKCDSGVRRQRWYVRQGKIRSYIDSSLCVHFYNPDAVVLKKCKSYKDSFQVFRIVNKGNNRFEFRVQDKVLTQRHHPKPYEGLRLESKYTARDDETSMWVVGQWTGHGDGMAYPQKQTSYYNNNYGNSNNYNNYGNGNGKNNNYNYYDNQDDDRTRDRYYSDSYYQHQQGQSNSNNKNGAYIYHSNQPNNNNYYNNNGRDRTRTP